MRDEVLPAPRLGQDTQSILRSLGYDEARIAAMLSSGAAFEDKVEETAE
jgi:crotonobetainyl-CoA:carnitine CoA-transferase CaiB-like acyl-CoA transferase